MFGWAIPILFSEVDQLFKFSGQRLLRGPKRMNIYAERKETVPFCISVSNIRKIEVQE
jgi:hypothetical protein